MIKLHYNGGRFGNRLLQLSCAVALSHKFKQNIDNPMNQEIIEIPRYSDNQYDSETVATDDNIETIFNTNNSNNNIIVAGFFQKMFCIREAIKYNTFKNKGEQLDHVTFVHVRLDDIERNNLSVPYEYYDKAISSLDNQTVVISSDNPESEIVKKLANKYNAHMYSGDAEQTILMGANCRQKVLSLGTFSWWMGFLGDIFLKDKNVVVHPNYDSYTSWHMDIFSEMNWRSI